ncbi:CARDB domain-containing protein [Paenibacillus sp. sgz500992]|uniref:CARDB domain-containing protein n=1 Tax=Paenibacillus sp. sgz500992 TaxID=3242476 RepID=UPI0036D2F0F3
MRRKMWSTVLCFGLSLLLAVVAAADSSQPMLNKYVNWDYGKEGGKFNGYVPALEKNVLGNPWKLHQWAGLYTFSNGQTRIVSNYDAFSVKQTPADEDFNKENGFGLVYKSKESLGGLFDAVWGGQSLTAGQRAFFKERFSDNANDPVFKIGHEFFYLLEQWHPFLRTSGIVPRMGIKFDKTQKVSEGVNRAMYVVSAWPELKVTNGQNLTISYTGYGYTDRDIRLIAAPKGAFPDLSRVVSLTDGKYIRANASQEKEAGSISVSAKEIADVLGENVDIIMDDGYGRTAIQPVKLAVDEPMDYVPTKLTLTEAGQLWMRFRYDGADGFTSDYTNNRGMPMTASVKIGGPLTAEFALPSMFTNLPSNLKNGQEYNYMLGKIEIGQAPGKYYIKVDGIVNNPNHPDRALESPSAAYHNNTIQGYWTVERKAPEADLIAVSITASPSAIQKGGQSSITAAVKNNSADGQSNVLIRFFDNANKIYETRKSFAAGQSLTVGPFQWTGHSTGAHNLTVSVDPEKEKVDQNRSNNVATTGCTVTSSASGNGSECNQPEAAADWNVTYPVITGYPTKSYTASYTRADGLTQFYTEYYTDYSDPIWENKLVTYNEKLTISAEVNTKQGIATDLKRAKESDRESRGSWEIIPYANRTGKNANGITRAGYGIELKVKTVYNTNWETKVPDGLEGTAYPIGGQYYGPAEVYATFYDPNWKMERKIKLEKTSGNRNTATWELPLQTITSDSGKTYQGRKYMTSVNATDGFYRIKISTDPSGMNNLVTCITKQVEIFGSMYDDVQNLRRTD